MTPIGGDNEKQSPAPDGKKTIGSAKILMYRRELFGCTRLLLRCEGLDTVATLTPQRPTGLRKPDNMHRTYEFDVKKFFKAHRQRAHHFCLIPPPAPFGKRDLPPPCRRQRRMHERGSPICARPTACSGGTGGPRACPMRAFWRPISLVGVEEGRLYSVYVTPAARKRRGHVGTIARN